MRTALVATCLAVLLTVLPSNALAPTKLTIKVVSVSSPVSPGQDARLEIATSPGADCDITVVYKSGRSRARGLVPKRADSQGRIVWVWRVGTRTTPGSWPILVNCTWGQQRAALKTAFIVR